MMTKLFVLPWWVTTLWAVCALFFVFYLSIPNPPFPQPLPNSPQSEERGDSEELAVRRAYFTDFSRSEVLTYYQNQWDKFSIDYSSCKLCLGFYRITIPAPAYRLNHRVEDASRVIRDQTRSTFLEEIVHPFRESFYVNGFLPSSEKDTIIIDGRQFVEKITVKYVQSSVMYRVVLGFFSALLALMVLNEWYRTLRKGVL